jgi:hypothetical protein
MKRLLVTVLLAAISAAPINSHADDNGALALIIPAAILAGGGILLRAGGPSSADAIDGSYRVALRMGALVIIGESSAFVIASGEAISTGKYPDWYKDHISFVTDFMQYGIMGKNEDKDKKTTMYAKAASETASTVAVFVLGKAGGIAGDLLSGGSDAHASTISKAFISEAGYKNFKKLPEESQKFYVEQDAELAQFVKSKAAQ